MASRSKSEQKHPLTESGEKHPVAELEDVLVPGQEVLPGFSVPADVEEDPSQPAPGVFHGS